MIGIDVLARALTHTHAHAHMHTHFCFVNANLVLVFPLMGSWPLWLWAHMYHCDFFVVMQLTMLVSVICLLLWALQILRKWAKDVGKLFGVCCQNQKETRNRSKKMDRYFGMLRQNKQK